MTSSLHHDEYVVDVVQAQALVAAQFPAWAALPVVPVASQGTDNTIFRLGERLALRFPRVAWAAPQVPIEYQWLPQLAPQLPAAIATPVALGRPSADYLWPWYVYEWVAGTVLAQAPSEVIDDCVVELAGWLRALHAIPATGGPPAGPANHGRGLPLTHPDRDGRTRVQIPHCTDACDPAVAAQFWEAAVVTPPWHLAPVWLHGDPNPGNVVVDDGHLAGVIDFGCMGVGDPAVDLLIAWVPQVSPAGRARFRDAVGYDAATWARGRAWAFSVAVIALPYYRDTSPTIAATARATIAATIADWQGARR